MSDTPINAPAGFKPLADSFRSDGFNFTLVKRLGDIAIFAKRRDNWAADCATFEVVRIQKHKSFTIQGKIIPAGEYMPSSEQWGLHGWSYDDLDDARRRFNQLTNQNAGDPDTGGQETPTGDPPVKTVVMADGKEAA